MPNQDYLRWSAQSLKQLMINKLTEQGKFSDQIFEGSNLSVLIDIFSYTYDVLSYYLNYSASEAMFTDSQVYENMNRIVKLVAYNPHGFITSTVATTMSLRGALTDVDTSEYVIPKFTTISTGTSDSRGKEINFSFVKDYSFLVENGVLIDPNFIPMIYNGTWTVYPDVLVSTGIPYETFTLINLDLSSTNRRYLGHPFIYVYVKRTITGCYEEFQTVTSLFESAGPDSKMVEIRVNENKQYTLTFGDDVYGQKLVQGDILYVVFLESNGTDGEIGVDTFESSAVLNVRIDGFQKNFIQNTLLDYTNNDYITDVDLAQVQLTNNEVSSYVQDFETVDEIRANAPLATRMAGRLLTAQDFQQYIIHHYLGTYEISDVKAQNNWSYMVEFQQWLYLNGLSSDRPTGCLTSDIRYYGYKFADTTDFNNVYVWLKSKNANGEPVSQTTKVVIEQDVENIKALTSEVVMLDPFITFLSPYVSHVDPNNPPQQYIPTWDNDFSNFDQNKYYKIALVRDVNSMVSVARIKQNAYTFIKEFFDVSNNTLGQMIRIDNLYNQLSTINGVKEVQTIYYNPDGTTTNFNGLSFIAWTPKIVRGLDYVIVSGAYKLKNFQFPLLYDVNSLKDRIVVTSENFKINSIEI